MANRMTRPVRYNNRPFRAPPVRLEPGKDDLRAQTAALAAGVPIRRLPPSRALARHRGKLIERNAP